jgi:cyanate lyase
MNRKELSEKIIAAKTQRRLKWRDIAAELKLAPACATASLLGQMALSAAQARRAAEILSLDEEAVALLQQVPYRGSLGETIPTDPLIYRFYEITLVFGSTIKALIEEEFGDGIMSAIDFELDVARVSDPKGDRVRVTLNGKFLPYRKY